MPRLSNTALGHSSIDGLGVFAARDIKKGEPIDEDISDVIGFNHSCVPNVSSRRSRRSFVVAKRAIQLGEELTVSYRKLSTVERRTCNCPKCRTQSRGPATPPHQKRKPFAGPAGK